jgi:hypothetical protein
VVLHSKIQQLAKDYHIFQEYLTHERSDKQKKLKQLNGDNPGEWKELKF